MTPSGISYSERIQRCQSYGSYGGLWQQVRATFASMFLRWAMTIQADFVMDASCAVAELIRQHEELR